MGTVTERPRKDGSIGHFAQIVIKCDGKIAHREQKTFDRKRAAWAWIEKREKEIAKPGALDRIKAADPLLAKKPCSTITSQDLVEFAKALRAKVAPSTISNYMSHLGAVFSIARPAWGHELYDRAMNDAMKVARKLGYVGKSKECDRRPTLPELYLLMEHFGRVRHKRSDSIPMRKLCGFVIFATRRQEEIVKIRWTDLDADASRNLAKQRR